jgi:VanZ family protein
VLPLRFPKLWTAVAWVLTAGVIVGSLLPNDVVAAAIPVTSDKVLHAGSYFILMVSFAGLYRRGLYPMVAAALLALGVSLDLLQLLTETRSFDWRDIAMNSAGIAAGLVLSWSLLGGWCQRVEQRLLS